MIKTKQPAVLLAIALTVIGVIGLSPGLSAAAGDGAASLGDLDRESRGFRDLARAALSGKASADVRVTRFGDGWTKVSVPLSPKVGFRTKAGLPLETLGLTVDLFEPDLFADTVTYDVAPITGFSYHWGWVTVNSGNEDIEARSTIQRKGPGPDFKATENVVYDANSMNLVFVERPVGQEGVIHTIKVSVSGAKKLVGRICSDCVPATF